ncbi:MAG: MFS transporter [Gammaproteobacteria bacterium]|nr:MAG: MFS transporter [Gammaproteobacteria bacterium]UCH38437.1 MAG: MFS transporter [Gammaproteobacteria bacterium]
MPDSVKLLSTPRFRPFFLTQLAGAFNDNLYKNGLTIFIAFQAAGISQQESNTLVNIAAGLFILPFFLFSAIAGQLADKHEKSRLIRQIKLLEVAIMLLGALAFIFHSPIMLVAILFLMGTQSTLFGPVKYSLMPQALEPEELVSGNAMVEFGTFIAILIGLIASVYIIGFGNYAIAIAVVVTAGLGYWASRGIPRLPAAAPELEISFNIPRQTRNIMADARQNLTVFYSIMGISWFWFIGITYVTQLPNFVRYELGGNEQVYVLLLAMFSLGIGAGSFLCEKLSGRMVEIGLVPLGSLGLTLFGIDLYFNQGLMAGPELLGPAAFIAQGWSLRICFDIIMLGVSGGIYIVPLYALIQQRSDPSKCSRIIAANNVLNALFMVAASIYGLLALSAGVSIPLLFLIMALMNAAVALFIFMLVPEFIMRLLVWLLIHTVYRVDKTGLDNIPDEGPAVLVCNHVSFVDALVLAGCVRRPIRFVMYYKIFELPVLSFIFRTANAIPIAGVCEDPEMMEKAFDRVSEALAEDEIVCIFPEGKLTADGEMDEFKPGVMRILERDPVPLVPLALRGLWGSFFSRAYGSAMSRLLPRGVLSRIEVVAGEAMHPTDVSLERMRERVLQLRGDRL